MRDAAPLNEFKRWRNEQLFNIDFASYPLTHHSFSKHFHKLILYDWEKKTTKVLLDQPALKRLL